MAAVKLAMTLTMKAVNQTKPLLACGTYKETEGHTRNGEQESCQLGDIESLDNAGEEEGNGSSQAVEMVDEDEEINAIILESKLNTSHEALGHVGRVGFVVRIDIFSESPARKSTLFLAEPLGGLGIVRQDDGSKESSGNGSHTLNDEEPALQLVQS